MERKRETIIHQQLGSYDQTVFDSVEEAGHYKLASEGKYGWEMPADTATEVVLRHSIGKNVMELGCGWGNTFTLPALERGASEVYAIDITAEHVSEKSPMVSIAESLGKSDHLHRILVRPQWWHTGLLREPTVKELLRNHNVDVFNPEENVNETPPDNSLDLLFARHSIQFGTVQSTLRVFDLASASLKDGGSFMSINFTPYTNYLYKFDNGNTISHISEMNRQFEDGKIAVPGGFLNGQYGPTGLTLQKVVGREDLGQESTFLYFDRPTIHGLLDLWRETRERRSLPSDLTLNDDYYFTPDRIAQFNKLYDGPEDIQNKENYFFQLLKIA